MSPFIRAALLPRKITEETRHCLLMVGLRCSKVAIASVSLDGFSSQVRIYGVSYYAKKARTNYQEGVVGRIVNFMLQ